MDNILDEFQQRQKLVRDSDFQDSIVRKFMEWLKTNEETRNIISELSEETRGVELAQRADFKTPPPVEDPRDSILLGLYFINQLANGTQLNLLARSYGHDREPEKIIRVYINPFFDYIEKKIKETIKVDNKPEHTPYILHGDFRGSNININSTLTKSSQTIQNNSNFNEEIKKELTQLLEELNQVLSQVPLDKINEAEAVAWAAESLVEAKVSDKPNPVKIEITKESLQKAAANLASIMPTAINIAEKIITTIQKVNN